MREFLQILLEKDGHEVAVAEGVETALRACRDGPDLVFADLKLPDGSGMDVLRWTRDNDPDIQVIMMTAFATTETAVDAMRLGAYDYQIKPFKVQEIRALAEKALEKNALLRQNRELRAQLRAKPGTARIVGRNPRMTELLGVVEKVAHTRTSVLIEGESGTGKELVARAIHEGSPRASGPFVAVNCGAIPESLIESELFGHAAGSFTGAQRDRAGLFKAASGGTLLLDEVGDLPPMVQVKLLRALEERAVRAIGEERETPVDVRIVASTNRDLQQLVQRGEFREDLFYRLNVVRIELPPLRERVEDIPLLARAFLMKHAGETNHSIDTIEPEAERALTAYRFPGNVRELENIIERASTLATGASLQIDDLPQEVRGSNRGSDDLLAFPDAGIDLESTLSAIESRFIHLALERAGGNKTRAADLLGLSFRSLRYRIQKLGAGERDEQ
jgi:two-component system response regulator PilR (NtrC family)